MDKITFDYEYVDDILALHDQIAECEGRHTQQAIYSTFHGEGSAITPDKMTFSKAVEIWESYQ